MATKSENKIDFQTAQVNLIRKAWDSEEFTIKLRRDPKGCLEQELGYQLPKGLNVKLAENTETLMHVVLPAKQGGELSDTELTGVAGGAGIRNVVDKIKDKLDKLTRGPIRRPIKDLLDKGPVLKDKE